MAEFFNQLKHLGEEFLESLQHKTKLSTIFDIYFLESLQHKTKLSTIFDIYLEKVIPSFVSEKELKEYYERRMEEVSNFIDKL